MFRFEVYVMGFWSAVVGGMVGSSEGGFRDDGLEVALAPVLAETGEAGRAQSNDAETSPRTCTACTPSEESTIDVHAICVDDDDGRFLVILPRFDARELAVFEVEILDASTGSPAEGREHFVDENGDFLAVAEPHMMADGTVAAALYVPFAAVASRPDQALTTRVTAVGDLRDLGKAEFAMPWPPGATASRARLVRPLVHLAMRVARADGVVDAAETALVRDAFISQLGLDASDSQALDEIMATPSPRTITELVARAYRRFPALDAVAFARFLATVAHADGVLQPAEVARLQEIADAMGLRGEAWGAFHDDEIATAS